MRRAWLALWCAACCAVAFAANVRVAWDPPVDTTGVLGYELGYGEAPGERNRRVGVPFGTHVAETPDLAPGTWYFAARSTGADGAVSEWSEEIFTTLAGAALTQPLPQIGSWARVRDSEHPPVSYRASTSNTGSNSGISVPVPAGVQIGDIVIFCVSADYIGHQFDSWPTGFTEIVDADISADGQSVGVAWKRLTAVDTADYTSPQPSSSDWAAIAVAFSGRHATNPPVAGTVAIANSASSSPVSISANGVTAVDGDDILWVSFPDVTSSGVANGHTPPTNYTEAQDSELNWSAISAAYRNGVGAGATGTVTGQLALSGASSGYAAVLIRVPASESGSAATASYIPGNRPMAGLIVR